MTHPLLPRRSLRRLSLSAALSALTFLLSARAQAEVRLPALFTDHMVLQQGPSAPVWGWGTEGESVTVRFRGQEVATQVENGQWMVRLQDLKAGGPDSLWVAGKNQIEIKDVLVGEVWVCSGQSNMEWSMNRTHEPSAAIAQSFSPVLRLFTVPKLKALQPTNNINARWVQSGPSTVSNFSAVAYYFGRDLQKALNVPVGLIHTSWGGSPAEVWMSQAALEHNARYKTEILEAYMAAEKKPGWRPAELYNGMIAPLLPYAIQGAIWYQGESNAGRAEQYRWLFADMIRNWRRDWDRGDFPFLLVQLAPWDKNKKRSLEDITREPVESDWAELRDAQWLATQTLPNVGMAVITDVGDKDDIHPMKKEPVGARLALAARKIAYGERIVHSGPTFKSAHREGGKLVLNFDNVGRGLEARDGELKGFALSGVDRKFVWATAVLRGSQVVVSSPQVPEPVAARYGWSDFPVVNLWNKDGLPASPFRTDDFPMITAGKK